MRSILAVLLVLLGTTLPASAGAFPTRVDVLDLGILDTGRPAKANLWYPEGTCTQASSRFCLADSAVLNKVVVLSHGSMGSAAFASAIHSEILPWDSHGARYTSGIPGLQRILLEGQEGHFVFITPCRHSEKGMGVPLCEDRPGVDRAVVQEALARQIVNFARADDEPMIVKRLAGERPRFSGIPSNPVLQILYFTPRWVFGLLAVLLAFGFMQARNRRVAVWLALLLPTAMLLLSLSGVLQYVGLWWPALLTWMFGVSASSILALRAMRSDAATYDPSNRKLNIAGSWVPLFVMLGIFFVRYAIGVARAMEPESVRTPAAQIFISLTLGALSGIFAARALVFWRAFAASRRSAKGDARPRERKEQILRRSSEHREGGSANQSRACSGPESGRRTDQGSG